jgi:hypothetical protein
MIYEYLIPHILAQKYPLEKEYWGGYKYKPLEMSDKDFLDTVNYVKQMKMNKKGGRHK